MLRSAIVSLNRPQRQHRAAAGIDEQHVAAARLCLHALVEPIEIAEIGGVGLDAGGPRPDRLNGGVEFGLTATGHEDPRALRRETLGSGAADAGGAAGDNSEPRILPRPCPCCGGRMFIIETFARGSEPRHGPTPAPAAIRIDTS